VDRLCKTCHAKYFSARDCRFPVRTLNRGAASRASSLARGLWLARITALLVHTTPDNSAAPVRITHMIHGRSYVIEVRPVARDRWRAQIARTPGGMTSLMPFYGTTPDDAATQLAGWLTRAGEPRKAV